MGGARVVVHNPVTNYRFILEGGPTAYQWLNGTGVHLRDVPDASDFRLIAPMRRRPGPATPWSTRCSRTASRARRTRTSARCPTGPFPPSGTTRRTSRRGGSPTTSSAVTSTASSSTSTTSRRSGSNVVYLTPFFPARSNHRYDASTFDRVDPVLGGDEALHRLVDAAHARGMKVLGDFTTNHTGDAHEWFVAAREDLASEERGYYFWDDSELGYVAWLGVPSLPKLNYDSEALRQTGLRGQGRRGRALDHRRQPAGRLARRRRQHDRPLPRPRSVNHEVARQMREAMADAAPTRCSSGSTATTTPATPGRRLARRDELRRVHQPGLDLAAQDRGMRRVPRGSPLMVPRLGGVSVMETMREFAAGVPWTTVVTASPSSARTTRPGSARWSARTRAGRRGRGSALHRPGHPDAHLRRRDRHARRLRRGRPPPHAMGRRPLGRPAARGLPWPHRGAPGPVALREGGMRWVYADDDALVFLRRGSRGGGARALRPRSPRARHASARGTSRASRGGVRHTDHLQLWGDTGAPYPAGRGKPAGRDLDMDGGGVKARLADIAAHADVSEATVSRVLNGKPGVAESTRQAVLTALDVLGYDRPSRLRRKSAGLVGLIVPELSNPIFPIRADHRDRAGPQPLHARAVHPDPRRRARGRVRPDAPRPRGGRHHLHLGPARRHHHRPGALHQAARARPADRPRQRLQRGRSTPPSSPTTRSPRWASPSSHLVGLGHTQIGLAGGAGPLRAGHPQDHRFPRVDEGAARPRRRRGPHRAHDVLPRGRRQRCRPAHREGLHRRRVRLGPHGARRRARRPSGPGSRSRATSPSSATTTRRSSPSPTRR